MARINSFMVKIYQANPGKLILNGKVRSITDGSEMPFQNPEELIRYLMLHSNEQYGYPAQPPDVDVYPSINPGNDA